VHLADQDKAKVAIICGGGSGHEPAHAGFVGMCDYRSSSRCSHGYQATACSPVRPAISPTCINLPRRIPIAAVCGNIFASPGPAQVRRGIELTTNDAGTLIVVKNYTGDVLNFGLAKEQYAAAHPDRVNHVKFLVVGEDVAVGKTQGSIVGRRGLAGVILVYKIAGALAQEGANLNEVYRVAEWVSGRIATIGVGLDHCHVPGTAVAEAHLPENEIEIGMGIHNEAGIKRISPIPSLRDLVQQLLDMLLSKSDPERSFLPVSGVSDEVVLFVNNLGGVSELELGNVAREVSQSLTGRKVTVQRIISGTYMTSLNMPGFSVTLLLLPAERDIGSPSTDLILRLLDAPTAAPGWKWSSRAPAADPASQRVHNQSAAAATPSVTQNTLAASDIPAFDSAIRRACDAVIRNEPEITRMDTIAGDGDCGLTLQTGVYAVLENVRTGKVSGGDVVGSMIAISEVASEKMGGTSGALYSIFFSALAQGLQAASAGTGSVVTNKVWAQALASALENLYTYTRARPPSRTLVDPLDAFINALSASPTDVRGAVGSAAAAAEGTRDIEAKAGRSAYVESDVLLRERVPDPGAWGVKAILEALFSNEN